VKSLPPLTFRQLVLELALIAIVAVYGMREFINSDPTFTLHGNEAQWLTSSAQYVKVSWDKYGYIPLWQPYLSRGEPTIDSPFSFALSPFSSLPSFLIGYPNGIKISVIISSVLSGFGGWYLGRVLGFGAAGRLLLGLLFAVKGPQHTAITRGYFQLGTTQAIIPWVVASSIALVKFKKQRYPVVLLAFWITMLFLGGNIYYTLPAIFMAVVIMLLHLVRARTEDDPPHWLPLAFDRVIWQRMILSLVLTIGLAGITFIPILLNSGYIGRHPSESGWGAPASMTAVIAQLFSPSFVQDGGGVWNENYYIYTMPIWFGFIVFLLLPVLERALPGERRSLGNQWRIWFAGVFFFIFFTTWGSGMNAFVGWAYENLPLIGRWRNVNRMLTLTSFWAATFAALWIDIFWKRIDPAASYRQLATSEFRDWLRAAVRVSIGVILVSLSLLAVWEVVSGRLLYGSVVPESSMISQCVAWIKEHDDEPMPSVWVLDYYTVNPFIREGVRISNINADYDPLGVTPTIFDLDLTEATPEWIIPYFQAEQEFWGLRGWSPVEGSPLMGDGQPCAWRNPNALAYAFTIQYDDLLWASTAPPREDFRIPMDTTLTQPVTEYDWLPGKIRFNYNNTTEEQVVLVVQEVAWPGWVVRINGEPARLESVGQLIGYVIPPNSEQVIEFEFTAPLLRVGAIITALSVLFIILYLGRADRLLRRLPEPIRRYIPTDWQLPPSRTVTELATITPAPPSGLPLEATTNGSSGETTPTETPAADPAVTPAVTPTPNEEPPENKA